MSSHATSSYGYYRRKTAVVGPDGALEDDCIPMYIDEGCRYFAKCAECPLLRCYHEYEEETEGKPINPIQPAIHDSWDAGLRHPEFKRFIGHLDGLPPPDVYLDIVGHSQADVRDMEKGERVKLAAKLYLQYPAPMVGLLLDMSEGQVRYAFNGREGGKGHYAPRAA